MRYVLDASVAVAAVRPNESGHPASRARVASILAGTDEIAVPAIFSIEVAASLARVGWRLPDIDEYLSTLADHVVENAAIGRVRAPRIRAVAARSRLRAADAAYVWLAAARRLTLLTLDREVQTRAASVCVVAAP